MAFAGSSERQRLLRIVAERPTRGLFEDGDYPYFAANRLAVAGMQPPRRFTRFAAASKRKLLASRSPDSLFPRHRDPRVRATTARDIWGAALDAADALVTVGGYVATLQRVLELEPVGTLEQEILWWLDRMQADGHPVVAIHPGLRQLRTWARSIAGHNAPPSGRVSGRQGATPRPQPRSVRSLLDRQHPSGAWDEVEPLMREALAIDRKTSGERHWSVAEDLDNLGRWHQLRGEQAEAQAAFEQELSVNHSLLGDRHLTTIENLIHLGQLGQERGQLDAAGQFFARAQLSLHGLVGETHPMSLALLHGTAALAWARQDFGQAEKLARQALERRRHACDQGIRTWQKRLFFSEKRWWG